MFGINPYVIIWSVLVVMFWRVTHLGLVVDDDSWHSKMQFKKQKFFKDRKHPLRFLHDCFYGAGLFKDPRIDHLFTLFIHGVNCSLIYSISGSLIASLLYLINPINNQTVLWLNGRRYAVSLLGILLAWKFWAVAPMVAIVLTWFHVSGVAMPLLFLFTPFAWASGIVLMIAGYLGFERLEGNIRNRRADYNPNNECQVLTWKKSILYVKSIGYYFTNIVLPLRPAMYHDFLFYFSSTDEGTKEGYSLNVDFWKGIAVIGLLAYLIIWQASFWAIWFVLFISQWCNIYQVTMTASDRYCSIPAVGVMVLVAEYSMKLPSPYNYIVLTSLATMYVLKYQPLFSAYRNVIDFHQYHININPELINPRFFLSKIFLAKKDPHSAYSVIRHGMRYRPYDFKLMLGFIECLFAIRKPKSALQAMEVCEKHIPFGEEQDTKNLFHGIRQQFKKEYNELHGMDINGNKVIHNNGMPIVKVKPEDN